MDDEEQQTFDVFRDGRVHVLEDRCSTCVFHPGNRMSLKAGRLKEMVDSARTDESAIVCHKTLYGQTAHNAVCKGFYDAYSDDPSRGTLPLFLARRMGLVAFDTLKEDA